MRPNYIDIHAHVHFPEFDADRRETIQRALDAGIWMINVGTGFETSRQAVELARGYDKGMYAAIGLHPAYVAEESFDPALYRTLAGDKRVVAIGECGLDYFRTTDEQGKVKQVEAFKGQIELALELDLPLILHIRSGKKVGEAVSGDAYRDALDILRGYKAVHGDRLRGDVHFFAGSVDQIREFVELGFYISFTGVVTFAPEYEALVRATPSDRIMAETDCPYVAPAPHRGKRNEPAYVAYITDRLAAIKGEEIAVFKKQTVENAFKLFRFS